MLNMSHARECYNNDNFLFRPIIVAADDIIRSETRRIPNNGFLQDATL